MRARPGWGRAALAPWRQGNHADLLRHRGVYCSFYNSQFIEDLAEAS